MSGGEGRGGQGRREGEERGGVIYSLFAGCLRSLTDPTVTIIADNFVVPPGTYPHTKEKFLVYFFHVGFFLTLYTYQLQKPSRSGSFLSNRLKHLSIPINQIVKFADMQKSAMGVEESATAFKFPLVRSHSLPSPLPLLPLSPLSSLSPSSLSC